MESSELLPLLQTDEDSLTEFKREWHDFSSKRAKAEFSKDVIALANTVRTGETGYLVFGVDDPARGGEILGTDESQRIPSPEAIQEVLATYCNPQPELSLHILEHAGKRIDVLKVTRSRFQPHYAIRDVDGVLSTDVVYVRRGPTVGTLRPPEFEALIREKQQRLGDALPTPLEVGFVSIPRRPQEQEAVFRVANISTEPVSAINALFDIAMVRHPTNVERRQFIANMVLNPRESREFSFRPFEVDFHDPDGNRIDKSTKAWTSWLNVRLELTYRDRSGILRIVERHFSTT